MFGEEAIGQLKRLAVDLVSDFLDRSQRRRPQGVRVNWTSSMPVGVYLETTPELAVGSRVLGCLPSGIAAIGRLRGHLPAGGCPGGSSPILKQILALPGDHVDLRLDSLAVKGREVDHSEIRTSDTLGRELEHVAFGSRTVRDGELWVVGSNRERSWDSRYFGPIPIESVIGGAPPLATIDLGTR